MMINSTNIARLFKVRISDTNLSVVAPDVSILTTDHFKSCRFVNTKSVSHNKLFQYSFASIYVWVLDLHL